MSVWLEQARSYPSGVVATPHYLATSAGLAMLASGGNAIDAALAANLVLGVVTPYMCGVGGDLLAIVWDGDVQAYRGVGRAPAGATLDAVREQSGSDDDADVRAARVHRARARSTAGSRCSSGGGPDRSARSARPRAGYASDGFPLTRRGAWFFARNAHGASSTSDCTTSPTRTARRPPGRGCASPRWRARLQVLADDGPDAYYHGPIGAAIAERLQRAGGFHTADDLAAHEGAWVEPLRADGPRHRDPRDAAADPGRHRARGAAHRRRSRPRRRRSRSRAPAHRGDEARPRRPRRVRRRPRGDDRSTATTLLADDWIARSASTHRSRSGRSTSRPGSTPNGGTIYMNAADRDGLLVSLIQSNFFGAGCGLRVDEWGINLHNRGSAFNFDAGHPNAFGPAKMPLHTLIPGARAPRRPPVARVRERGRPRSGPDAPAAAHAHVGRRRRSPGRDHRAAFHDRPRDGAGRDRGPLRSGVDRRPPAPRPRPRRRARATGTVPASRTRSSASTSGYRAGSDPRAEGGVAGL